LSIWHDKTQPLTSNPPQPQAYELSVLTGTQVLLLVVSETGLVYTFTTPKLQPLVTKPEGKNLIQVSEAQPATSTSSRHTILAK
jgi:MADS-box transcription factor